MKFITLFLFSIVCATSSAADGVTQQPGKFYYEIIEQFEERELELLARDLDSALQELSFEFKISRIVYENLPEGNYPEHIVHHIQSKSYENIVFNFMGRFETKPENIASRLADLFTEEENVKYAKAVKYWAGEITHYAQPAEQFTFAKGQLERLVDEQSKEIVSLLLMTSDGSILLIERIKK